MNWSTLQEEEHIAGEASTAHIVEITPLTHYSELKTRMKSKKGTIRYAVYCVRPRGKIPFIGRHLNAQKLAKELETAGILENETSAHVIQRVTLSRSLSQSHAHSIVFRRFRRLLNPFSIIGNLSLDLLNNVSRFGSLGIADVILEIETKTGKNDDAVQSEFEQRDEEIRRKIVEAVKKTRVARNARNLRQKNSLKKNENTTQSQAQATTESTNLTTFFA